jgi:hypothetical protein
MINHLITSIREYINTDKIIELLYFENKNPNVLFARFGSKNIKKHNKKNIFIEKFNRRQFSEMLFNKYTIILNYTYNYICFCIYNRFIYKLQL